MGLNYLSVWGGKKPYGSNVKAATKCIYMF